MRGVVMEQDGTVNTMPAFVDGTLFPRPDCAYLLPMDEYDALVSTYPSIIQHDTKHPDRPLRKYLLSAARNQRGRIEAIPCAFSSPGRARQSIMRLLEAAKTQDFPCVMVIGIEDGLFGALSEGMTFGPTPRGTHGTACSSALSLTKEQRMALADAERRFLGLGTLASRVREQVVQAMVADEPVMILGPTGTGKEVVARLIHDHSRPGKPYVPVNCGGIAESLFEAELFGNEPNVFTDAGDEVRPGLWEMADDGTLFLDEIGELPLHAQVKILRALQEGAIRRVGATGEIKVNARIIAATNRDLHAMVEAGTFREDLFYRLRVLVIRTPGIADNAEQLPGAIQSVWQHLPESKDLKLSKPALTLLAKRSWVGNYRDLKTFLRALAIQARYHQSKTIEAIHVRTVEKSSGPSPVAPSASPPRSELDREVQRLRYREHHAMCAEVLRALQLAIEPMTKRGGHAPRDLDLRLRHGIEELRLLLSRPHQFCNGKVFSRIDAAREAAQALREAVPRDERKAKRLAKHETMPKIADGLQATYDGL